MGQQIHLGIAYKTGRKVTEEEFRKLAYRSVKNRLFFSCKERECEELFNKDFEKWKTEYNDKISEFVGLNKDDNIDLGPDLNDTPFYKYVNMTDGGYVWLVTPGTWLTSDMSDLAKILNIPYCSTVSISDETLEQVCKVFNYFLEPAAWNKAVEKMFLSDNAYFDQLQDVAPYNFYTRFAKPKDEKKEEISDDESETDEGCEDEDEEEEYEYSQDEDFHYWGIKSFMDMVEAYTLSRFSSYGDEKEPRNDNVKFVASF